MDILGTDNPDTLTGTSGDDQIEALASSDVVSGGDGNDSLDGGSGNDQLLGGAGSDDLYGGTGRDLLNGGAGADLLYGGDGIDTVDYSTNSTAIAVDGGRVTGGGDAAGDRLDSIESVIGTAFADAMHFTGAWSLDGRGGDDILSGADTLLGGDGNDTLSEGHELHGGAGDDTVTGSVGALLFGDDGNDLFRGPAATIDGGAGTDTYQISLSSVGVNLAKGYVSSADGVTLISNVENVTIDEGSDVRITGTDGDNVLILTRGGGDNTLLGGAGDDTLIGGGEVTRFVGGAGADHFEVVGLAEYAYFYYSDSTAGVNVNLSTGLATGGEAQGDSFELRDDTVTGLIGSQFDDTLRDSDVRDLRYPHQFDGIVYGGAGNDRIIGGLGRDWLSGGTGADTFAYEKIADTADRLGGEDRIIDFSSAQGDKIDLSAIDADDNSTNGRTPFTFVGQIGSDPDVLHVGEIGYTHQGTNLIVYIGTSQIVGPQGYAAAIYLQDVSSLTAGDFVL
ncbi:calcium-binding protein [Inquilinus limosus]|uniref:Peptidase M10 serralysin C-terminal domain-containing protein n=1 Tax=Inquilinus limosus TaxID=171674 RepID=A0A211ZRS8_9PROT|nr:calcium-binding protein [Inquilinus limosus]OWJ67965.1 hypothetical protein BWR60_07095 [Inquilinus limosus]